MKKDEKKQAEEPEVQPEEKPDHEKNWEMPKGYFRSKDTSKKLELIERMKAIQSSKKKKSTSAKAPKAKK